jgi:hypothetical protein
LNGNIFTEPLHLAPGRIHRGAHAFAHRAKHREVRGVGQMLLDERDGDIEGQARDRDAHLRGEIPLSLARARRAAAPRLSDHRGGFRVPRARRCACHARDLRFGKKRVVVVRFRAKSHFARFSSTKTRRRRLSVCVGAALVVMRSDAGSQKIP